MYLAARSRNVVIHDFVSGFVRTTGEIFPPLVLKTVLVFASYLNGRRSSFAIFCVLKKLVRLLGLLE